MADDTQNIFLEQHIPCPHIGVPYSEDLSLLDEYIANHVGIKPTKYISEVQAKCPDIKYALKMQQLMAHDHMQVFGALIEDYSININSEDIETIIQQYLVDIIKVPTVYGAIEGGSLDDYFQVGINRSYTAIRKEIKNNYGTESAGYIFTQMMERYLQWDLSPWKAARLTTLFIAKVLTTIASTLPNSTHSLSIPAKEIMQATLESQVFSKHLEYIAQNTHGSLTVESAFKRSLARIDVVETGSDSEREIYFTQKEVEGFCLAYHLMERPYEEQDLLLAQELLVKSHDLRNSIILFHSELIKYCSKYIVNHPNRLAHNLTLYSEVFIPVLQKDSTIHLIPNPKLLKVISKNIIPAIARSMIIGHSAHLTSEYISHGIEQAKEFILFQTMIGKFNQPDPREDKILFKEFFGQTCPAMRWFANALMAMLPRIYEICENLT